MKVSGRRYRGALFLPLALSLTGCPSTPPAPQPTLTVLHPANEARADVESRCTTTNSRPGWAWAR